MFLSPDSARAGPKIVTYPGEQLQPDQIRLVKLLPGQWRDPIVCELYNVDHETASYQCLSYVWGSRNVTRLIRLKGVQYPVTVNLNNALRHLREENKDGVVLWIDALCIHQEDVGERMQQVQMMGRIYEKCQRVIVYLGDRLKGKVSTDEAPPVYRFPNPTLREEEGIQSNRGVHGEVGPDAFEVFALFQELSGEEHIRHLPTLCFSTRERIEEKGVRQLQTDLKIREDLVEALRMFMHPPFTPWWSRIWVVQEVTAPPEILVVYGTISAPWLLLATAAFNYVHHSTGCCQEAILTWLPRDQTKVLSDCCHRILDINEMRIGQSSFFRRHLVDEIEIKKRSILALLRRFRDRKASDSRDKVYALLSLVHTPRDRKELLPDYSLSEAEVFRLATLESIYTTKSLSVFSTDLGRKFRNDLPSWVPDWSAPGGQTYSIRAEAVELFSACGEKATDMKVISLDQFRLHVVGLDFDVIRSVLEPMWGDDEDCCKGTISSWWSQLNRRRMGLQENAGFHMLNFWKTICGDVLCESQTNIKVRRTVADDELSFVMWAQYSNRSPFSILIPDAAGLVREVPDEICTNAMKAWRDVLMLWSGRAVLETHKHDSLQDADYVPDGPLSLGQYSQTRAIKLEGLLDFANDETLADVIFIDHDKQYRRDAPWRQLLSAIQGRLIQRYGDHVDLDVRERRKTIPIIDNSIMAATLARRFFIGENHVGLGPVDTQVGDAMYLLVGGKTPLVLRSYCLNRMHSPGIPRVLGEPKPFEVVGDCYVHGVMDGHLWDGTERTSRRIELL